MNKVKSCYGCRALEDDFGSFKYYCGLGYDIEQEWNSKYARYSKPKPKSKCNKVRTIKKYVEAMRKKNEAIHKSSQS